MIEANKLLIGDNLHVHPFSGVEYEEASNEEILSIKDIEIYLNKIGIVNEGKGNVRSQIINRLKELDLLPLRYNSPKLPIILKIMGFIFGDGALSLVNHKNRKKGMTQFYGNEEDLINIKNELKEIGIKINNIYKRKRHHKINTKYGVVEFDYEEKSITKKSTGFLIFLACLGVPVGKKTHLHYRIPNWIIRSHLWQKRLFLASFFGAELGKPRTNTENEKNFDNLQLNMNKKEDLKESAIIFLNDIRLLLVEFGIATTPPVRVIGNDYEGKSGRTIGLRFSINGEEENLNKFFSLINYEYNKKRNHLANLAIAYLNYKKEIKENNNLNISINNTRELTKLYKILPSLDEFIKSYSIGNEGFVLDEIKEINLIDYNGSVYDFTINHKDHNFISNNFVISNCGMRLLTTNLTIKDVQPKIKDLVNTLFKSVPSGVGCKGFVKMNNPQFNDVMENGVKWCIDNGYGWKEDLERIESNGKIEWADSSKVSQKARQRGIDQLGTLGSGNHYLEIQHVKPENIIDEKLAKKFGIFPDQIVVMFHTGSRGFGHQVATDYLKIFEEAMKKYNIHVNDKELSCAPFSSKEGQDYYKAMACAANMAFSNRQVIMQRIRESFEKVFKQKSEDMEMHCIYDVAHNLARLQKFKVDGKMKDLVVHRKGATLCQGPGNHEVSKLYRDIGSPVIIGGSMETGSYLLVGTEKADNETFSSTAHGSGRTMSRHQAKKEFRGEQLQKDMEKRGIYVKSGSFSGLAEEAGAAYKDINDVIETLSKSGISKPVVKLIPIGNIK